MASTIENNASITFKDLQSCKVAIHTVFVGLSFKKGLEALDGTTISGELINEIAQKLYGVNCLRMNLVDWVVANDDGRLRTPSPQEIGKAWVRFEDQLSTIQPKVVVALGKTVAETILKKMAGIGFNGWCGRLRYKPVICEETTIIAVHHPSHIAVYRRKERSKYVVAVTKSIKQALS